MNRDFYNYDSTLALRSRTREKSPTTLAAAQRKHFNVEAPASLTRETFAPRVNADTVTFKTFDPSKFEDQKMFVRTVELERECFPADEGADKHKLSQRFDEAADLYFVAHFPLDDGLDPSEAVAGFICGSRTSAFSLTEKSMHHHEPNGETLCIHTVAMDRRYRRRGIARKMLNAYLEHISKISSSSAHPIKRVVLLCKEHLRSFYESFGFQSGGRSSIVLGQTPWLEMRMEL